MTHEEFIRQLAEEILSDEAKEALREIAKKERDRIGRIQFASAGATRKR